MATVRVNIPQQQTKEEDKYTFQTFKEEIKNKWIHKREVKQSERDLAQSFPKVLLALQCPSQLYLFLFYIIPRLFEDYTDETQICLQLFVCFCCLEGLLNYFLCLLTDSDVKPRSSSSKIKPYDDPHAQTNGHVPNGVTVSRDDGEMPWGFCDICNMDTPPRAHHCKICKKCILKRDHHCFMVGNCIGFYNQRYFFVLGFYAILCGLGAFACNAWYLYLFYWPTAYSWTSLFPPIAFYRWLFGYENIEVHILILIFQAYPQLFFGGFGCIVVNSQTLMCFLGKTAHELTSHIPIKNNNFFFTNFESVFGKHWLLNFIFPMTQCLKQPGDGTYWDGIKIDHVANSDDKNKVVLNM